MLLKDWVLGEIQTLNIFGKKYVMICMYWRLCNWFLDNLGSKRHSTRSQCPYKYLDLLCKPMTTTTPNEFENGFILPQIYLIKIMINDMASKLRIKQICYREQSRWKYIPSVTCTMYYYMIRSLFKFVIHNKQIMNSIVLFPIE